MKKNIHPTSYQFVVFEDLNDGNRFLTRACVKSEETTKWEDGNTYPLVKIHISSSSHPFFTGQEKLIDIEGRVDKFEARRKAAEAARKVAAERNAKSKPAKAEKEAPAKIGATDKQLSKPTNRSFID